MVAQRMLVGCLFQPGGKVVLCGLEAGHGQLASMLARTQVDLLTTLLADLADEAVQRVALPADMGRNHHSLNQQC